MNHDMKASWV